MENNKSLTSCQKHSMPRKMPSDFEQTLCSLDRPVFFPYLSPFNLHSIYRQG